MVGGEIRSQTGGWSGCGFSGVWCWPDVCRVFDERAWVLPLAVVENRRIEPVRGAVFAHAKIMHVMEGRVGVETAAGAAELGAGMAVVVGAGRWCSMRPHGCVRTWTVFVDEGFLRGLMGWLLPDRGRVVPGVHPTEWDGSALVGTPGVDLLGRVEPLWRQMSVLGCGMAVEAVAARLVCLFVRSVEVGLPALLLPGRGGVSGLGRFPVRGRLAEPPLARPVRRGVVLLRSRMAEPWTVTRLARAVAVSRTHLTRLFTAQVGVAPMRFLTEVRLTEFTRLIEETDLPVFRAARLVGWADPRVASAWFRRRFGTTPTQFRRHAHSSTAGANSMTDADRGWGSRPPAQT